MNENVVVDSEVALDLSGLRCPVPVLRLKKHVKTLGECWTVVVKTTDVDSVRDFQEFARIKSYDIDFKEDNGRYIFIISSGAM